MNKNAIERICNDINAAFEDNAKKVSEALFSLYSILTEESKIKKPQAGKHFSYKGIEFVVLGEEQGGILAVVSKPLDEKMPFNNDGNNDWHTSSPRSYLNEEYLAKFEKADLLPFTSDLTSDDGMDDYGSCTDYIALLSDALYRKYRKVMPKYDNWVWTITPYSCTEKCGNRFYARVIDVYGALHNSRVRCSLGVAPACIFNPKIFE